MIVGIIGIVEKNWTSSISSPMLKNGAWNCKAWPPLMYGMTVLKLTEVMITVIWNCDKILPCKKDENLPSLYIYIYTHIKGW